MAAAGPRLTEVSSRTAVWLSTTSMIRKGTGGAAVQNQGSTFPLPEFADSGISGMVGEQDGEGEGGGGGGGEGGWVYLLSRS